MVVFCTRPQVLRNLVGAGRGNRAKKAQYLGVHVEQVVELPDADGAKHVAVRCKQNP